MLIRASRVQERLTLQTTAFRRRVPEQQWTTALHSHPPLKLSPWLSMPDPSQNDKTNKQKKNSSVFQGIPLEVSNPKEAISVTSHCSAWLWQKSQATLEPGKPVLQLLQESLHIHLRRVVCWRTDKSGLQSCFMEWRHHHVQWSLHD